MRVTRKGQVTIPKGVREQIGIAPGTEVSFEVQGSVAVIRKKEAQHSEEAIRRRYEETLRLLMKSRGKATSGLGTEEIMEMTRGPFDDVDAR